MKINWKLLTTWIAGITGASSCIFSSPTAEYGCPYSDYNVDVVVTDEAGKAIRGIETDAAVDEAGNNLRTDVNGRLKFKTDGINLSFVLKDVDGPENGGEFQDRSVDLSELQSERIRKGDGWYQGEFNVTGTVKMEKKTENTVE